MKCPWRHIPLLLMALMLILQGCSAKKNTAGSRFWQAFTTRYNVYYHGKTNYDEQLKEMEDKYEDDYSQRMFIHPAEARNNPKAPQPTGSFDRTIEKMQKAIALHSIKKKPKRKSGKGSDPKYREWLKRDEYNPFIHNAWFLLAKAEYMKGDFLDAAATFRYIYRHFTWKPDLVVECQVWEAMCYCALDWPTEADNVLAHVHPEKIEDTRIRSMANLAFANYYSRQNLAAKAIPYLENAIGGSKGQQKVRLNFLLGQLYEQTGQKDLAYRAYKAAGSSSGSTYRTKFNARIKQSAVFIGDNIESEVKSLKAMTRYDRNNQYLDQIYYAIGNLYLSHRDTVHAVENYELAAKKSTRNGIDKAISQLTLGGIYFAQHKYDKAQPCYAEGITVVSENYPNYKMLKRRSDVLDELAVYAQNVTLQDSLLKLSKMTPEEQRKVIKKIIDELKKKEKEEKDEAQRQQYMAKQNAQGNQLGQNKNAPTEFQMNADKSWYFYNTATKNAGKTAFQQAWGNRKLEDDWRRRDKTTFSLGDDDNGGDDDSVVADSLSLAAGEGDSLSLDKRDAPKLTKAQQDSVKRLEDPHYEEYYLKQIPKTEEQIQAAHDIIQEGLYNMGVILKDKLEDYDAAALQFATLMERYPENTYRLEVYYNLYLMYMRLDRPEVAEQYREKITSEFADSKYGQALQDPLYFAHLKNMLVEQEAMYDVAYNAYLAGDNSVVHGACAEMQSKYPLSKIMPKFMFIDALSYVTERDYDKFKSTLKEMLERYPQTDITPVASAIVKQLNAGRKLESGGRNVRGMLWSTRLSNDSTGAAANREVTPFKEDNNGPQVFVLLYPTDEVSGNMLLYEVARHNFNTFVVKDYDLEQMTFGGLGLLVVRGFANFDEVRHYRTIFEADESLSLPSQVHPVLISNENFELLLNEGRSFEDYFNFLEEINDTEHGRLETSPEEVLDEAEIAAAEQEEDGDDESEETAAKPVKSVKPGKGVAPQADERPVPSGKADITEGAWNDVHDVLVKPQPKAPEVHETPESPEVHETPETPETSENSKTSENSETPESTEAPENTKGLESQESSEKPESGTESGEVGEDDLTEVDVNADARTQAKQRKELEKKAKAEEKARKKAEREAQKQREREEEERLRAEEEASRERERAQQDRYRSKQQAVQAERDSIAAAKKEREKERKLQRKLKQEEQKAKQKEREKQRKEREKQRKAEQKAKEKARKEAAKQREQERKEREKQREQERKEREKERKAKRK